MSEIYSVEFEDLPLFDLDELSEVKLTPAELDALDIELELVPVNLDELKPPDLE